MKKHIYCFSLFLILCFMSASNLQAQNRDLIRERTKTIRSAPLSDQLYVDLGFAFFSEYAGTQQLGLSHLQTIDIFDFSEPVSFNYTGGFGMYGDVRVNLIEYYDVASLSLNIPLGFSINAVDIRHSKGYGAVWLLYTPVYLQYNMFLHSSKERIDPYGFFIGIGFQTQTRLSQFDREVEGVSGYTDTKTNTYSMARIGLCLKDASSRIHKFSFSSALNPLKVSYKTGIDETESKLMDYYFGFHYYINLY